MSEELAARKKLLLARSNLHRLEMQLATRSLGRSLFTPRTAFSFVTSAPVRPLLFSALLALVGGSALSRVLRGAMVGLSVVKTMRAAGIWRRGRDANF
jgi:hypothetical protein